MKKPSQADIWHVYLAICADDTCYCGITCDIKRRMAQHNGFLAGGAKYTRSRRPIFLLGAVLCKSKGDALRLEAEVKSWTRSDKLRFFSPVGV